MKITKCLNFLKKNNYKNYSFFELCQKAAFILNKSRSFTTMGCLACCGVCCNKCCCVPCCGYTSDLANLTVKTEANEFYVLQIFTGCGKPLLHVKDLRDQKVYYTVNLDSCCPQESANKFS